MASRDLVGYDYIAAGLGLLRTKAVREYRHRHTDFPTPTNPEQRSPLFRRVDADRYITAHRRPDAPERTTPAPLRIDLNNVVDFAYVATALNVSVKTAYKYGTPTSAQHVTGFPRPVTPAGVRTPLFNKTEIDIFVARRRETGTTQKGRTRLSAHTPTTTAAAAEIERLAGRPINLESRNQLQQLLFTDLRLPLTAQTSRGPSVSTAALAALSVEHPHPILDQLLIYRGVTATSEGS